MSSASFGQWYTYRVRQLNGSEDSRLLPAQFQMVSECYERVITAPYLVYIPEKDRLLMLVNCDYPHQANIMFSDDRGETWTPPRPLYSDAEGIAPIDSVSGNLGVGLTYLGEGKVLTAAGLTYWFSRDYGETWGDQVPIPPMSDGRPWYTWDPLLVDLSAETGKVVRLAHAGYVEVSPPPGERWASSAASIRFSTDGGRTWDRQIDVPEWTGLNEVALVRAANGDIVAACRTDNPPHLRQTEVDHYSGLVISRSSDNGLTWSPPDKLYDWGRHHPHMLTLPNGDIILTYVVRRGYPETTGGFPQFGVEAVVSHDHGATWDLDHRYILAAWPGHNRVMWEWWAGSQSTSLAHLPDGSLITAFGTYYRALPDANLCPSPRDVGLVRWRPNNEGLNDDRSISNASPMSDVRNCFDPSSLGRLSDAFPEGEPFWERAFPGVPYEVPVRRSIACAAEGATVRASDCNRDPIFMLWHPYYYASWGVLMGSIPAWVEIDWPRERRIDQVAIHPGLVENANNYRTERVPVDYRLQYRKGEEWIDLVPPVVGATRVYDFFREHPGEEFRYCHSFAPVSTTAVRLLITKTSDVGKGSDEGPPYTPPERRKTWIRRIEVFEAE